MTTNSKLGSALVTMQKAVSMIEQVGLKLPTVSSSEQPINELLGRLAPLDPKSERIGQLAQVFAKMEAFNALIRENTSEISVADAHVKIAQRFDSVRSDVKDEIDREMKNNKNLLTKVIAWIIKMRRGSIQDRYRAIQADSKKVMLESKDDIQKARNILEGYENARFSFKEASLLANDLVKEASADWENAKESLRAAQEKVDNTPKENEREYNEAQLARDIKQRELREAEGRFQIAKDLSEEMSNNYNVGQAIMARLVQLTETKDRVFQKSSVFFVTADNILTGLGATLTQTKNLNTSTKVLEAMSDGINKGLEDLGQTGDEILRRGVRAGYGVTIRAESLKTLLTAIEDFQASTLEEVALLRKESQENTRLIENDTENTRRRLVEIASRPVEAISYSPTQTQAKMLE